jgi:hypothetical protein
MNGALRSILHRRGDLIERRGGLFEACCLLFRTPRKIIRRRRNFPASHVDRIDILAQALHCLLQLFDRAIEISAQFFGFWREHRKPGEAGGEIVDRDLILTRSLGLTRQPLFVLFLPDLYRFGLLGLFFNFLMA